MLRQHLGVLFGVVLGASACVSGSGSSVTAGDGISVNNNVVSVDQGKVPLVPTSCAAGQVVAKTSNGWECVTPAEPGALQAGDGITVEGNTVSARFGTGHTDVATGDHNHDGRYRKVGDTIAWSEVNASSTDVWPGTVPYSAVTGAPTVDWSTVSESVTSDTSWPGTVDYSHLANAPAIPAPYTDAQARAAVTWSTVGPTVPPGGIDTSRLSSASMTITPQAPLTGGGTVALGGATTIGLAPGPAGSVLVSTGSGWAAGPIPAAPGQSRTTTGPLTLYVRTDGDDTACNGSANAAKSAAPNCAVASPQQAVNLVPEIIEHPVTIQLAAGTYYAAPGAQVTLAMQRHFQGTGASLTVTGMGSVILSGANGSTPGTASAMYGLQVNGTNSVPGQPAVTISGLTIQNTTGPAIDIAGSAVTLDNMTVTSAGGDGLVCWDGSLCITTGNVSVTGVTHYGVHVYQSGALLNQGTLTSSSNGGYGIYTEFGSTTTSSGTLNVTGNLGRGIDVDAGMLVFTGTANISNNSDDGIYVEHHGHARLQGSTTLSGDQNAEIREGIGGDVVVSGPLTITNGTKFGIQVEGQSSLEVEGSSPVNITCTGSNQYGIAVLTQSMVGFDTTGNATISDCWTGLWVTQHAEFNDANGPRLIQNSASPVYIDRISIYNHGAFPAPITSGTSQNCFTESGCF